MGLDMYLNRSTWLHLPDCRDKHPDVNIPGVIAARVVSIEEQVGYWRKQNAIHKWFVDNVQGGVDDCGNYDVSREQLSALRKDCIDSIAAKDEISSGARAPILPPQSGFFFGGTDIDEWYWRGLTDTVEIIDALLRVPDSEDRGEYKYQSSW